MSIGSALAPLARTIGVRAASATAQRPSLGGRMLLAPPSGERSMHMRRPFCEDRIGSEIRSSPENLFFGE